MEIDKRKRVRWVAAVLLRQEVSHRRTFFYLEQLILKHDAAAHCIRITQMDKGINFFFAERSHATKFMKFIGGVIPARGREVVSQSNTRNFRFIYHVLISPICREDLIFLPPANENGLTTMGMGALLICTEVTDRIALLDLNTPRDCFLDSYQYWRSPFKSLFPSVQLEEYIISKVVLISKVVPESKYLWANALVFRVSDDPKNRKIIYTRTHLGRLLSPGDRALGYQVHDKIKLDESVCGRFSDVVLIKKSYDEKREKKRGTPRSWKLKSLDMEVDGSSKDKYDEDYEQFLRDLEESPEMRRKISLYRNKEYQPEGDDDGVPSIPLEELIDD